MLSIKALGFAPLAKFGGALTRAAPRAIGGPAAPAAPRSSDAPWAGVLWPAGPRTPPPQACAAAAKAPGVGFMQLPGAASQKTWNDQSG